MSSWKIDEKIWRRTFQITLGINFHQREEPKSLTISLRRRGRDKIHSSPKNKFQDEKNFETKGDFVERSDEEWKKKKRRNVRKQRHVRLYIRKCPCIIGISILSMANGFDKNIGNSGWSKGLEKPKIGGDGRNDVAATTSVHNPRLHPSETEKL